MSSNNNVLITNTKSFHNLHAKTRFPRVFKMPIQIGEYCVSPDGIYESSGSRLYFLKQMGNESFPISLNAHCNGIDVDGEAKRSSSNEKYLGNLFIFLRSANIFKRNNRGHVFLEKDFVCSWQVLQSIMCTPYEKGNWTIVVSKYRNTVYMCHLPDQKRSPLERLQQGLADNYMTALRQHCLVTTDSDTVEPNANYQKDLSGQYYGVFTIEIGGIHVLFNAPMLAEHDPSPFIGMPKMFVNLKLRSDTMKSAEWSQHNVDHVLKWWAESFLVGIEKVYIANHDNNGLVHSINIATLRDLYRECENDWSPNVCANFLEYFLGAIRKVVANVDCASSVYQFEYNGNTGNLTHRATGECNEHSFIPDWYRIIMNDNMDHLNAEVQFHV